MVASLLALASRLPAPPPRPPPRAAGASIDSGGARARVGQRRADAAAHAPTPSGNLPAEASGGQRPDAAAAIAKRGRRLTARGARSGMSKPLMSVPLLLALVGHPVVACGYGP